MSQKLVLIDGHSILNRAFYGVPDLSNAEGLHTNAIYGFLNIMFKILEEEKPEYLAVAFDVHAPTFRHKMYEAYKGTRKPMPQELREQVPVMKEVLKAMHITIMEQAGLEADDILGTLAKKAEQAGMEVSLVSGDRDLLQIATDHIKIRIPKTKQGRTEIEDYYAADVQAAYQVTPLQFIELKALMGDTADNIPGVPKVGEKTAQALMVEYGSLDNIYAHVDEISKKSIRESLIEHKDLAELSKTLATIKTDCKLQLDYEQAKAEGFYTPEAYTLCKRLEFKNLLGRFEKDAAANDSKIAESFRQIEEKKEFIQYLKKVQKQQETGLWLITEPVAVNTKKEETETINNGGTVDYTTSSVAVSATRWVVYDEDELKESGQLDGTTFEAFKAEHSDPVQVQADQEYIDMIAKATGFDTNNISFVCYERPQFVESSSKGIGLTDILQIALAVLIFALLGYVVFRSTRKQVEEEIEPELSVDALLESTANTGDELENIGYSEKSETRVMIEKFVDENPDAAALLLRNWLNEDWE